MAGVAKAGATVGVAEEEDREKLFLFLITIS